jgi:hypothetical protein
MFIEVLIIILILVTLPSAISIITEWYYCWKENRYYYNLPNRPLYEEETVEAVEEIKEECHHEKQDLVIHSYVESNNPLEIYLYIKCSKCSHTLESVNVPYDKLESLFWWIKVWTKTSE